MNEFNVFSRIFFTWMVTIMKYGYKSNADLRPHLLPNCDYITSRTSHNAFELANKKYNPKLLPKIRLLPLIWCTTCNAFIISAIFDLAFIASDFTAPYVLSALIDFISNNDNHLWHGIFYAISYCFFIVCARVLDDHNFWFTSIAYYRVQASLTSALYCKMLRLSPGARRQYTTGEINNIMGVDVSEICMFFHQMSNLYGFPLCIGIGLYILWLQLGSASLSLVAVMLIAGPFTTYAMRRIDKLQTKQMEFKDKRMHQISEVLNNIKLLKLFGWEKPFMDRITKTRNRELRALNNVNYWRICIDIMWTSVPMIIAGISFTIYTLTSIEPFSAKKAFVSLFVLNMIRSPMARLPNVLSHLARAIVSFRRIQKYLSAEELDESLGIIDDVSHHRYAISLRNCIFAWNINEEPILKDITLNIKRGSLVAIVGRVGSGKSSLFSAILGDMYQTGGQRSTIAGSVSYVPQTAWIQNMTLRDNIVFVSEYESTKYERVVNACALKTDFDLLPARDLSEIGEKGINLSGGQKHRVSLARAVYQDTDVYLLDDPLAAVDAHVAQHLFEHVIGPKGLLRQKTRLLATHNIYFLKEMDCIILMSGGRIQDLGTYEELSDRGMLSEQMLDNKSDEMSIDSEDQTSLQSIRMNTNRQLSRRLSKQTSRQLSQRSESEIDNKIETLKERLEREAKNAKLIDEEHQQFGSIEYTVYLDYLSRCGLWLVITSMVFVFLFNVCDVGSNYWVSLWTSKNTTEVDNVSRKTFVTYYWTAILLVAVFILFAQLALRYCAIRASRVLHSDMLYSILRTPLSFFDTTPLGRIINRFNQDFELIDTEIPFYIMDTTKTTFWFIIIMAIIVYTNAYMIIFIVIVIILFVLCYKYFLWTARQLNRLNSITRSPVYSHFNESISGAVSIRVYRVQQIFIDRLYRLMDININIHRHMVSAALWIEIWCALIASIIILSTAMLVVNYGKSISPGVAGFLLIYSVEIVWGVTFSLRMAADLETEMVAVERVREYSQVKQECNWESTLDKKPNDNWPAKAQINFIDYSASYRSELAPVLKNINFRVESGEKVGIVGRTGAGKSSITLALFRIIEPKTGQIVIDDIDITQIGLHDLRSKLTIIPQEPNLFAGTLRLNLDPLEEYSDQQLWTALERSHLKDFISQSSDGLLYEIAEGGDNLSAGQRQLVCLARAMLRNTRILILDEATAACDLETDLLIQSTIKEEFSDSTVLTIAHRLNTVLDYNKIIVLDNGMIKEMDSPDNLLRDSGSLFYSLAKEFGIV
ncbi:ATP-binding cassette sub-family C member 2-like [Oppia nitens]|uniref:ATP-binding cassette sub-family C member 2-like n=1 Tax=Oppia nitens TaxID=1686743 RepID=UPI0023DA6979|nr:ATP-binding cassette sub-family C member 2-like [Oppia nitens]